jgi:hypothetical protein
VSFEPVMRAGSDGINRQVGVVRRPDAPGGISQKYFDALMMRAERIEYGYKLHETDYVMTDDELARMNKALSLEKDKEYRPYCLMDGCDMPRMFLTNFGFQCASCGNKINFDLIRHER